MLPGSTGAVRGVGIGAVGEQALDRLAAADLHRDAQQPVPASIDRVGIGARLELMLEREQVSRLHGLE